MEGQLIRQGVDNREMRVILIPALTASSLLTDTSSYEHYLRLPRSWEREKILFIGNRVKKRISDEKRNALLVVAALLVTVTFQAVITPPGGLWQNDLFALNTKDVLRRSPDDLFGRSPDDLFKLNITAPHRAGSAIAKETLIFSIFLTVNSLIFLTSIAVMVVLVPPSEIVGWILSGVSLFLYLCYFSSLMIITQAPDWSAIIVALLPMIYLVIKLLRVRDDFTQNGWVIG